VFCYCSEPTGALKLVIQSSALRAAMLDPDRDESDECDRPLTRAELEARAVAMTTKPQAEVSDWSFHSIHTVLLKVSTVSLSTIGVRCRPQNQPLLPQRLC
jgi:hypothetical protein